MGRLALYYHTLRHLRVRQLWFQLVRRLLRARPDTSPPPPLRRLEGEWVRPAERAPSLTGPGDFLFLNRSGNLDEIGWSGSPMELLWRYNQHYFDDLAAEDAPAREHWHRGLITRWIAENPPGTAPGWDPYTLSLRLVNWCKWLLAGNEPVQGMAASMAVQARLLTRSLELHILGNHLIANAKALTFAGSLFEGKEADGWLALGLRLLERELPEQILADGGNYERSPMYHALCVEDLLDLVNLAEAAKGRDSLRFAARLREIASGALFWLETMCHPDGEIAQFNDSAIGIAPTPEKIGRYAGELGVEARPAAGVVRPGPGIVWLRTSGYVRAETDGAVLFCDVAPLGPDYLPAHGHADTLSFELSVEGRRTIVNGGTSRYGNGPAREAERGTAAHSTVTVEGRDSSEVWGGFRVARRAYAFDISVSAAKGGAVIAASHNGYQRLPGSPTHRRTWCLSTHSLTVEDAVMPARSAIARYIAHPDVTVSCADDGSFAIGRLAVRVETGKAELAKAHHSPRFGSRLATEALLVSLDEGRARVALSW